MFRKKTPTQRQRSTASSTSPSVFSYRAARNVSDQNVGRQYSSEVKPSHSWHHTALIPAYLAGVVLVAAVLHSMTLSTRPRVALITAKGSIGRPLESYEQGVGELWAGTLTNRSKLTVDTAKLNRLTAEKYPELTDVKIQLPILGRRPSVTLTLGRPALQLNSDSGAYYIGSTGTVLASVQEVKGYQLDIPLLEDKSGIDITPGAVILTGEQITHIIQITDELDAVNRSVESLELPSTAVNELDVRLTGEKYYLKFALEGDIRQAVGSFVAADKAGKQPREYVDLRVNGKVYYR